MSDWRDAELDLSVFIGRAVDGADLAPLVPWAAARLIETLPSSGCVPYAEGYRELLTRADRAELAFHRAAVQDDPARPRNEWTAAFVRLLGACECLQHGNEWTAAARVHDLGRTLAGLVASAKLGRAGGVRLSEGASPATAVREWRETYAETLRTWCPKPPPL